MTCTACPGRRSGRTAARADLRGRPPGADPAALPGRARPPGRRGPARGPDGGGDLHPGPSGRPRRGRRRGGLERTVRPAVVGPGRRAPAPPPAARRPATGDAGRPSPRCDDAHGEASLAGPRRRRRAPRRPSLRRRRPPPGRALARHVPRRHPHGPRVRAPDRRPGPRRARPARRPGRRRGRGRAHDGRGRAPAWPATARSCSSPGSRGRAGGRGPVADRGRPRTTPGAGRCRRDPVAALRRGEPPGPTRALDLVPGRPRWPPCSSGIGACWSEGELSPTVSLFAVVATVVGNVVAYRRRADPWPGVKPVLAVCAVGGFVWFLLTVTRHATPGDIATVEAPLAVLFAWVLSTHAFDVPSRRDVAYSLAGSTALIAVAAAQSVDLALGVWVLAWVACCVWGLVAMWQSVSQTGGVPWRPLLGRRRCWWPWWPCCWSPSCRPRRCRPRSSSPSSSADSRPVDLPVGPDRRQRGPAGPRGQPARAGPASAGSSASPSPSTPPTGSPSGNEVVMRVRATRPNYWVGQTFDEWNGQSLGPVGEPGRRPEDRAGDRRLTLPHPHLPRPGGPPGRRRRGHPDLLPGPGRAQPGLPRRQRPAGLPAGPHRHRHPRRHHHLHHVDGRRAPSTRSSPTTSAATPAQLEAATAAGRRSAGPRPRRVRPDRAGPLPAAPPRRPPGTALARSITAGIGTPDDPDPHTYAKVDGHRATWMAPHIRYTTDIPPAAGRHRRRGLASSSAPAAATASRSRRPPSCMLRSLGHPGPRGRRLRARPLQPDHRPLRHPGQGRPRLGAGLVPRLRLAELRPHGRRAAGQPDAGLGAGLVDRPRPRPPALDPPRPLVAGVTVGGRGPPAPGPPSGHLGPPGGGRPGPGRCPHRPAPPPRRDAHRLRRAPRPGAARPRRGHRRRRRSWSSGPPTAASSRAPTRSPRRSASPGGSAAVPRRRRRDGGHGPARAAAAAQDAAWASASSNEAPAASSGR